MKKQEAKSTTENLAMAVIAENLESDLMYPAFIKQAKEEDNKDAVQAFTYAQQSERNHATLYKQALDNFNEWKTGKKDFFVCSVCGYTVTKVDFEKCPSCGSIRHSRVPSCQRCGATKPIDAEHY